MEICFHDFQIMYVFFSHESKYDLQLSDLHENCAHRVFLTDSEVFCLSHENILGHKTHGMTCTRLVVDLPRYRIHTTGTY